MDDITMLLTRKAKTKTPHSLWEEETEPLQILQCNDTQQCLIGTEGMSSVSVINKEGQGNKWHHSQHRESLHSYMWAGMRNITWQSTQELNSKKVMENRMYFPDVFSVVNITHAMFLLRCSNVVPKPSWLLWVYLTSPGCTCEMISWEN